MDLRFKRINYNRQLNTSQEVKTLVKDLIDLIRYYEDKISFDNKNCGFKTCNRFMRLKMGQYIKDLKKDLGLWYGIYRFKKWVVKN